MRDGEWRTLDSRGIYKSVVTLSDLHEGVMSDLLTEHLGWGWDQATTARGTVKYEVMGGLGGVEGEFSRRVAMIRDYQDRLVAVFVDAHGRAPRPLERVRLAQQANLAKDNGAAGGSWAALSAGTS